MVNALLTVLLLVTAPLNAAAREPLGESQLDAAGAGGIVTEVTLAGAPPDLQAALRNLVVNNVAGDSRVVTRVMIELVPAADSPPTQKTAVTQSWPAAHDGHEENDNSPQSTDEKLVIQKEAQQGLSRLVVNNIVGSNLVETIINLYAAGQVRGFSQPQGSGLTGSANPAASFSRAEQGLDGDKGPQAAIASLPQLQLTLPETTGSQNSPAAGLPGGRSPLNIPSIRPPPATLQGTISMLQSLAPISPDIASDIAALQQLQNQFHDVPGVTNP